VTPLVLRILIPAAPTGWMLLRCWPVRTGGELSALAILDEAPVFVAGVARGWMRYDIVPACEVRVMPSPTLTWVAA
jgi:hypothetical protein